MRLLDEATAVAVVAVVVVWLEKKLLWKKQSSRLRLRENLSFMLHHFGAQLLCTT